MTKPHVSAHSQPPVLIAIGGLVGTGKTTLAQALLPLLPGAVLIDADLERKKLFGVGAYDALPEDAYSPENIGLFIEHMKDVQRAALAQHSIVLSTGTWLTARARQGVADICDDAGAQHMGLWLDAKLGTLFNRLHLRGQGKSFSDADATVLERMTSRPVDAPAQDPRWRTINADQPIEKVVVEALQALNTLHAQTQPVPAADRPRQFK